MRTVCAILLFAFFCPVLSARADVIFSGNVSTTATGGTPCSNSGSASFSFSLACGSSSPTTTASLSGSGDAYSGSLNLDASVAAGSIPGGPTGHATATGNLDLNQAYELIGGNGPATVTFAVKLNNGSPFNLNSVSCDFSFDGGSQPCDLGAGILNFTETVTYGIPFYIAFDATLNGVADNGEDQDGVVAYDIAAVGLTAIAPEPSSLLLLIPGLAGTVFAAKSRYGRKWTL